MALKNNPTLSEMQEELISKSTTDNLKLYDSKIETHSSILDEDNTPVSTTSNIPFEWYDKDGNLIAHIELQQTYNNDIDIKLGIRRYIDNDWVWKQFSFGIDSNGEMHYNFPNNANALSALGLHYANSADTVITSGVTSLTTGELIFLYE